MGTCGQIALVPGTLRLAGGGPRAQSALSLRHLTRVLRALHPRAHIRSVVQVPTSLCEVAAFKVKSYSIYPYFTLFYGF